MAKQLSALFFTFLLTISVGLVSIADAQAEVLNIKSDAPQTYVVKKGDTLWDISNLFLDQPWLWPELWRNNTQIENPHLIFPGDVLRLRYENGVPVLEVVREKASLILTPDLSLRNKPAPIETLPWAQLEPYILDGRLMSADDYSLLPSVVGDSRGTPMFSESDFLLALDVQSTDKEFQVVRKVREVYDSLGKRLGIQVESIGDAMVLADAQKGRHIIKMTGSFSESMKGDKLSPKVDEAYKDLMIMPADDQLRGELVENASGRPLVGKGDVVIINLGETLVSPGTVFGIYEKGVDIEYTEESSYSRETSSIFSLANFSKKIEQPAFKVGELIVFNTFEHGSYAFVTKVNTHLKGGELIAAP